MIFSKDIINDIKTKSGLIFDRAGDFELLSSSVYKITGRTIGVTTLKRLFNYIQDNRKASEYTLNTIAIYLGYETWESYIKTNNFDSEWGFVSEAIYPKDLNIEDCITVKYLNRIVVFQVIEYEQEKVLKVIEVTNSSLKPGDIVFIHHLKLGEILIADRVLRDGSWGNYKTNGEIAFIDISTHK